MTENPLKPVSKAEKERLRGIEQEKIVLSSVIKRLRLSTDTTWKEINNEYSSALITVLRGEAVYGVTVQNKNWEKAYKEAKETLKNETEKIDTCPFLEEAELLLARYGQEQLEQLTGITLKEEALENELRKAALKDRFEIAQILKSLQQFTNVESAVYEELDKRMKKLSRAIGAIQGDGTVEHLN